MKFQLHFQKKILFILTVCIILSCSKVSKVEVLELKCEYRVNPLEIDNTSPRLSWKLVQDNSLRGQKQTAY